MSKNFDTQSTIVAITTPIGTGGVAIVRLSGASAIKIADKLFSSRGKKPSEFLARELVLGKFEYHGFFEQCMCVVFVAPNSFTGENVVEFQCHGGIKIAEKILSACLESGARMAQNGEFSLRAFLNGKLSLSEAEGMIDMINAETDAELSAGYKLMSGKLTKKVREVEASLVDCISELEVSFDYPEEDIEYSSREDIKKRLNKLKIEIGALIDSYQTGNIIKNGINVVICGKPNVGKSSLLNALLKKDKAIVTSVAGTTRDSIEDTFEINGVKVNIVDTAGIRETTDKVEKIGVQNAKKKLAGADLVLFVVDGSAPLDSKDEEIYRKVKKQKHLIVVNKADKKQAVSIDSAIVISSKKGENLKALTDAIYEKTVKGEIYASNLVVTNARHVECLKRAQKSICHALAEIDSQTLDLISIDLNEAYTAIGEITGDTSNEKILDSIFSKFCLGK